MKFQQQPRALMMVKPASFGFNSQTSSSNVFQHQDDGAAKLALGEFGRMVDLLRANDIDVHVMDDSKSPEKPDAIFPNNWVSFHPDGSVVLYPMMAANRRAERNANFIESIRKSFSVGRVIDLTTYENENMFLEGTGSLVFDHGNRIAYACRSPRTSEQVLDHLCRELNFRKVVFDSVDENGNAIYHTNVMMSVGEKFAVVCLDSIRSENDQEQLLDSFHTTGHRVIAISYSQMRAFAGNIIEVKNSADDCFVLMSSTALKSLLPGQVNAINQFAEIIDLEVGSIEKIGGGGVRCMVAGIHLPTL